MSIVVLKRKSRRYKAPISGIGSQGFSLNGGYRNQGSVGPTNLARSVTRTPFRGTEPMGHGGCCGGYVKTVSNSGSCCTNDPGIIKKSNKNTKGLISSNQNPTDCGDGGSCPTNWVQDTSPLNHSQGTHIKNVQGEVLTCECTESERSAVPDAGIKTCDKDCDVDIYNIGGKRYMRRFYAKRVPHAMSASEYMRTSLLRNNNLPTDKVHQPFPMTLNHNGGCNINFLTPADALAAGQLPNNWIGFR